MKRCLAWLLAMALMMTGAGAFAESALPDTPAIDAQEPLTDEPAADEPAADEPAADEPAPALARVTILPTGTRTVEESYEHLIVGSTTRLGGSFFTGMWGNNTCDVDVRDMIHGYSLIAWQSTTASFVADTSVASGISAAQDVATGDKTYTIVLNPNLTYNDGTPITARDYVFAIMLSLAPQVKAIGAATDASRYIVGSDAYATGESNILAGVRLIGEDMFSLTIKSDYLPFFYEMSMLDYSPCPMDIIAPGCELVDGDSGVYIGNIGQTLEETLAAPIFTADLLNATILDPDNGYQSHPMRTCGPYTLTSYDAEASVAEFAVNPFYQGDMNGQLPRIQRVTFKHVAGDSMVEELKNGTVDLINKSVRVDEIDAGLEAVGLDLARVSNYMRVGLSMLSFNCERGPSRYQAVRQAIARAFDKDAFIARYVGSYGMRVDGYYGIGQWMVQLVNGTLAPPVTAPAPDADDATQAAYQAQLDQWDALTIDDLDKYPYDPQAALALLTDDGWTLNLAGEDFDPDADDVRCKLVEGELTPLDMTLIAPEGNQAAAILNELLVPALREIGVKLTVVEMPFDELLRLYYRHEERDCDLFYLATNFVTAFDPSYTYAVEDEAQGTLNTSGLRDDTLASLAKNMRATDSTDVYGYCEKWIAFERYWNEVLPAVPVYSNVYFDFYSPRLQEYNIANYATWPRAILYATLSDPATIVTETPTVDPFGANAEAPEDLAEDEDEGDGDGFVVFE